MFKFSDKMRLPPSQSDVHVPLPPSYPEVDHGHGHGPLQFQYESLPANRPMMKSPPELSIPLHIGLCGSCSKLYQPQDTNPGYEAMIPWSRGREETQNRHTEPEHSRVAYPANDQYQYPPGEIATHTYQDTVRQNTRTEKVRINFH